MLDRVERDCTLFHCGDEAFAEFEHDGHGQSWPVPSQGFSAWLRARYFEASDGGAPNNEAFQTAIGTIAAQAQFRGPARNEHELFIAARNTHVLAFDNLSTVPAWLSDALCRLSTGAGFAARKLYTDDEESVISAERPVLLNSIDAVVTRGDLADRALVLTLEDTPKTERKTESELWADFERARPHILGALLDAMVVGLNRVAEIRLDELPRMADFATWVVACEPGVFDEGAFLRAYTRNRKGVVRTMMDAEPVAGAICDLMRERRGRRPGGLLSLKRLKICSETIRATASLSTGRRLKICFVG